tara:strand:+ start:1949 stop:2110 length:162 start_codon:yes stop_codon:yes gene_type:complete
VNNELDSIETDFPDRVSDLKSQITNAKDQTQHYEDMAKKLQQELAGLKAAQKA